MRKIDSYIFMICDANVVKKIVLYAIWRKKY